MEIVIIACSLLASIPLHKYIVHPLCVLLGWSS